MFIPVLGVFAIINPVRMTFLLLGVFTPVVAVQITFIAAGIISSSFFIDCVCRDWMGDSPCRAGSKAGKMNGTKKVCASTNREQHCLNII